MLKLLQSFILIVFCLAPILGCSKSEVTSEHLLTVRLQLPEKQNREFPEAYAEFEELFAELSAAIIEDAKSKGEKFYFPPHQEALEQMGYVFPVGSRFTIDHGSGNFIITNSRTEVDRIKRDFSMKELPY